MDNIFVFVFSSTIDIVVQFFGMLISKSPVMFASKCTVQM